MTECTVFVCKDPNNPVAAAKFGLDEDGQGHFVYGARFTSSTDDAFSFDPINLPLTTQRLMVPVHRDGSFGVLSDAGPNTWGQRLTISICKQAKKPVPITPVDWVLSSFHYGAGCFAFSRSPNEAPSPTIIPVSLDELDARFIKAIDNLDKEIDPYILRLVLPGASLGGVRPKTVVMHDGYEHIAKFNKQDDLFDVSTVEYASMRLAYLAKIEVPDFEQLVIAGRPALLVKRFDRTDKGHRIHYISAHSLLNIGALSNDQREYQTNFSYAGIAEITRPFNPFAVADSHELFRRMVFNILIGNVDDHLRNHGFLMAENNQYRLSPAFDLLPHIGASYMPQSIGVGAFGAASTMMNALSQCRRFFLEDKTAKEIISEVKEAVSNWRQIFRESGVSENDIHLLASCFTAADAAETASNISRGS